MLVRVLLSLTIVLALALVTIRWVLPRVVGMAPGRGRARRLELLDALPLDRQHRVTLVRAGGREYLLGLGAGHVTAIDSWPVAAGSAVEAGAPAAAGSDREDMPALAAAAPAASDASRDAAAPGGVAAARARLADLPEARR